MANLLRFPVDLWYRDQHEIFDDFTRDIDAAEWVATLTDTGTATVGDAVGGIVALVPSDGTVADNDEAYLESPNETFLLAAGKPLCFETRIQFTEANTDDANIMVGLMDAVGADSLLDNGGGPKATFDGAVIYKIDGGTVWRCKSSRGTTATDSISTTTAGGAAYQTLRIEWHDYTTTQAQVTYYVNGQLLLDSLGNPIRHVVNFASATEVQVALAVKNGGANLETLNVDYVFAGQVR